jgi:hypothetical protein
MRPRPNRFPCIIAFGLALALPIYAYSADAAGLRRTPRLGGRAPIPTLRSIPSVRPSLGSSPTVGPSVRTITVPREIPPQIRPAETDKIIPAAPYNPNALRNPSMRAFITANLATSGSRISGNEWWRHHGGRYGWVGPLFWPFAYYDIYDYAMWGEVYDAALWDYGLGDIYAGIFIPYDYDDLVAFLPRDAGPTTTGSAVPTRPKDELDPLAQTCSAAARNVVGVPVDEFEHAIKPSAAQRDALGELADASVKAAQAIKSSCPKEVALTAPSRLSNMEQRIESMLDGVVAVQPALQKFHDLLTVEQKQRLVDLATGRRQAASSARPNCGVGISLDFPVAEIEGVTHLSDAQRGGLERLKQAARAAADELKASCLGDHSPPAPSERLAAVKTRLDSLLQAVRMVHAPLSAFYDMLSDEQKAKFEAIGRRWTNQTEASAARKPCWPHCR